MDLFWYCWIIGITLVLMFPGDLSDLAEEKGPAHFLSGILVLALIYGSALWSFFKIIFILKS